MDYRNSEMKLDQLIGYFNDGKINLIPPFQRGHVWSLSTRQSLVQNIVNGRPIPAIFLYKEAVGSKYTYNILDGKQRLESLLLFIGAKRTDVFIKGVKDYFYNKSEKESVNFPITIDGGKQTFEQLSEERVRDFREYAIATIEISLEESSLDEIISLFIDINQQGVKVNRFDIVKAIGKNPLLHSVFSLIAQQQKRKEDMYYKKKKSDYTKVLEKLQIMQNLPSPNAKVDRMWERLLEIVLFCRTGEHRPPAQILKSFIRGASDVEKAKITPAEMKKLKGCFVFLSKAYANGALSKSKLATDQTHFYTMVTSILHADLLSGKNGTPPKIKKLQQKLVKFAKIIDGVDKAPQPLVRAVNEYKEKSKKQTTHIGQRGDRQALFLKIIGAL